MCSSGLFVLAEKLKRLKHKLCEWNKNILGRVDGVIRELEERLEILEGVLQSNFSEERWKRIIW